MKFSHNFSTIEWILAGLYICLYGLYLWRVFGLAKQLKTSARAVIPKLVLRTLYFSLLLLALRGPTFGNTNLNQVGQTRDVWLLVDVSRSMDATDTAPTRLERVKYDIRQLTDSLPGARFGLILVADKPTLLLPLTTDQDAVKQVVRDIRTEDAATGGTNLCSALGLATQKINTDSTARRSAKAIVLFSDGENFASCNPFILNQLRTLSTPVFTLGVGTETGSTIKQTTGLLRDERGEVVQTRLNRAFLQELAQTGRGQYIEINTNTQWLTELVNNLMAISGPITNKQQVEVAADKYAYFLIAALILLLIDLLVTIRTFRL
jgi:Ca-activated chloride channel homolog